MGFLSASKDLLIETVALPTLNRTYLKPYGQATKLRFDSTAKTAELVLELIGESEPLHLQVHSYELEQRDGETYIVLHDVSTSRQWLTALAKNLIVGRPWKLPKEIASSAARFI